jgi:hypothetical protein
MSETETPEFKGKATWRLGQRELARLTMAVIAVIVLGLVYGGWKAVEGFKTKRDLVIAQDNLLNLYRAMRGYALDYDSKLPPAETWSVAVLGYLNSSQGRPGGRDAYLKGTRLQSGAERQRGRPPAQDRSAQPDSADRAGRRAAQCPRLSAAAGQRGP